MENHLSDFYKLFARAMSVAGLDLNAILKAREELESAGFINVREMVIKMPIGDWMEDGELKEIGHLYEDVMRSSIPGTAMRAIIENMDWSWLEVTVLGALAKHNSFPTSMYFPLHIVTGQKPVVEESL